MYLGNDAIRDWIEKTGAVVNDPWDLVSLFEQRVAEYAGAKYGVAVDSCTSALFLCLKYLGASGPVAVPRRTYVSVAAAVLHAGCELNWIDAEWRGAYRLDPYPVVDSAARFTSGMYVDGTFHCVSFHRRKTLAICKGGMILANDEVAADWFRLACTSGRDMRVPYKETKDVGILGWNMYMPPEQAALGLIELENVARTNDDSAGSSDYLDISSFSAFSGGIDRPHNPTRLDAPVDSRSRASV